MTDDALERDGMCIGVVDAVLLVIGGFAAGAMVMGMVALLTGH